MNAVYFIVSEGAVPKKFAPPLLTYKTMNHYNKKHVELYTDHTEHLKDRRDWMYSCHTFVALYICRLVNTYALYGYTPILFNEVDIVPSFVVNFSGESFNQPYYK